MPFSTLEDPLEETSGERRNETESRSRLSGATKARGLDGKVKDDQEGRGSRRQRDTESRSRISAAAGSTSTESTSKETTSAQETTSAEPSGKKSSSGLWTLAAWGAGLFAGNLLLESLRSGSAPARERSRLGQ
jgi:hypothetical protein